MRQNSTTGKRRGFIGCLIGSRNSTPVAEEQNGVSPFDTEFFMVQGVGFKCMAYRSGDGQWRTAFENQLLPGKIRVLG
jgi:hypothetical protein